MRFEIIHALFRGTEDILNAYLIVRFLQLKIFPSFEIICYITMQKKDI